MRNYLTFFHNSDFNYEEVPSLFKPRLRDDNKLENIRPAFYWFNDFWHSNFPNWRNRYFYLFIKNPQLDGIEFRSRHPGSDFNGLYAHYVDYLKERDEKHLGYMYGPPNSGEGGYYEPSILMSYDDIIPDLMVNFSEESDRCGLIIKPEIYKGTEICFFKEDYTPIKFIEIPKLVEMVPNIKNSLPFIKPKQENNIYIYEDWLPIT